MHFNSTAVVVALSAGWSRAIFARRLRKTIFCRATFATISALFVLYGRLFVVYPATNLQSKLFTHRRLFSLLLFLVGFQRCHLHGPMVTLPTRIVTLFLVRNFCTRPTGGHNDRWCDGDSVMAFCVWTAVNKLK